MPCAGFASVHPSEHTHSKLNVGWSNLHIFQVTSQIMILPTSSTTTILLRLLVLSALAQTLVARPVDLIKPRSEESSGSASTKLNTKLDDAVSGSAGTLVSDAASTNLSFNHPNGSGSQVSLAGSEGNQGSIGQATGDELGSPAQGSSSGQQDPSHQPPDKKPSKLKEFFGKVAKPVKDFAGKLKDVKKPKEDKGKKREDDPGAGSGASRSGQQLTRSKSRSASQNAQAGPKTASTRAAANTPRGKKRAVTVPKSNSAAKVKTSPAHQNRAGTQKVSKAWYQTSVRK
ncbi:hypothetical protein CC2G_006296 [Coprinopsis cinerea AmutBmut pab1-1]|nr:hypothetical protein CC2G_006296 [Coprinopsis cinerea AmutBmut pab1-1]